MSAGLLPARIPPWNDNLVETIFPACNGPKFAVETLLARNENTAESLDMVGCIWELFGLS